MKVLLFVVAMCHWSACLFWVTWIHNWSQHATGESDLFASPNKGKIEWKIGWGFIDPCFLSWDGGSLVSDQFLDGFLTLGSAVQVIGRPESLMTDLLPQDSAESFKELNHWTTLPRRDGADQGHVVGWGLSQSQENHESRWQAVKIPKVLGWWLKVPIQGGCSIWPGEWTFEQKPMEEQHLDLHGAEGVVNEMRSFEADVS